MIYCGGAHIFWWGQLTADGGRAVGAWVCFWGWVDGAAVVCSGGDVVWLIAGEVVEQGAFFKAFQ